MSTSYCPQRLLLDLQQRSPLDTLPTHLTLLKVSVYTHVLQALRWISTHLEFLLG